MGWTRERGTFSAEAVDAQQKILAKGGQLLHRRPVLAEEDEEVDSTREPLRLGEAEAGLGSLSPTGPSDPECDETYQQNLRETPGSRR